MSDSNSNRAYYQRRAGQERAAADRAADDRARQMHLELERRYNEAAADTAPVIPIESNKPGLLTPEFRILG